MSLSSDLNEASGQDLQMFMDQRHDLGPRSDSEFSDLSPGAQALIFGASALAS